MRLPHEGHGARHFGETSPLPPERYGTRPFAPVRSARISRAGRVDLALGGRFPADRPADADRSAPWLNPAVKANRPLPGGLAQIYITNRRGGGGEGGGGASGSTCPHLLKDRVVIALPAQPSGSHRTAPPGNLANSPPPATPAPQPAGNAAFIPTIWFELGGKGLGPPGSQPHLMAGRATMTSQPACRMRTPTPGGHREHQTCALQLHREAENRGYEGRTTGWQPGRIHIGGPLGPSGPFGQDPARDSMIQSKVGLVRRKAGCSTAPGARRSNPGSGPRAVAGGGRD